MAIKTKFKTDVEYISCETEIKLSLHFLQYYRISINLINSIIHYDLFLEALFCQEQL